MSTDESSGWGITPPPFKADEALQRLRRELREMGLTEREGRFERRGMAIARLGVDGDTVQAAIVRAPSRNSPQWQSRALKSGADVRDFATQLKRQLGAWSDHDD